MGQVAGETFKHFCFLNSTPLHDAVPNPAGPLCGGKPG